MWVNRIISRSVAMRFFSKKYTKEHEWIILDKNSNIGTVGITEYAQQQLGDIVHITLPKISQNFKKDETLATVESVKVVSDIFAPVTGVITEVNKKTEGQPEIVNQDAEGNGWLFKMKLEKIEELSNLLEKSEYDKFLKENSH